MSLHANSSRHDTAAPGFGQSYDPFADLSRSADDIDEALDFEDTYDGLGDALDETDDAFNDDTFGGDSGGVSHAPVGKDFDFFGQTAKVANAIEEEHQRFSRQQPAPKSTQPSSSQTYGSGYAYQPAPKPARTGYEKYKSEPVSDLQVDASIWGVQPKKATPVAAPAPPQSAAPPAGRKMMSLEEVEAAMRAQAKAPTQPQQPQQPQPQLQAPSQPGPEPQAALPPAHYPHQEPINYQQQQFDNRQPQGFYAPDNQQLPQGVVHGHPIAILQRPASKNIPSNGPNVPVSLPQQHQPAPMGFPTQILQNPNRMPGEPTRMNLPTHPTHRSQNSFTRQPQASAPQGHLSHLSEQEKASFLEAEARRAKRNHKIHVLSKDNGLMTPQDKSFITRIQLQQLVSATGDPSEHGTDAALAEDFYYQVLSSLRAGQRPNPNQPLNNFAQTYLFQTGTRHGGMRRQGRGPENHMQRMEQQVQRAVEAAKNKPKNKQLVIEGSLGKISFSNAKTPKPLLNIKRTESSTDATRPGSGHRSHPTTGTDKKETLQNIEKVYLTLMKMEDLDRNMPPPPANGNPDPDFERRAELQQQLQQLNEQLWNELKVHEPIGATSVHPFIAFLSYPKGKKAIGRVFNHLTLEQQTTILTIIVIHLDQLDVVRGAQVQTGEPINLNAATRESIELFIVAVMPSLLHLLGKSELHIVTGVLGLITQNLNVDLVARTRIGVSMLTMILSRAELAKQAGQATEQSWQQWVATFNQFFNALEPTLPNIFPGTVASGEDIYVWQFLAAIGIGASPEEQQRLVLAVKDRVMDTVSLSKTLPPDMAKTRLDNVNLFMRSIGLDVELLNN
ncbi:topoisomerase II-associated protein PAT1 [Daldinia caldariorum]|uniref:topoisomerase II-associated protein PAT1 n=1 Tax=Daldinia caldariorum TaxID=326644 RepID=UPI002007A9AE|nr:topoisomerase II-associated protein PAT1 [Daldinia caldariorum]KAI1469970.1 topoisomerase II-associated protein PAT1 [Daldinia caldariorum]